jgi:hypothetical protein
MAGLHARSFAGGENDRVDGHSASKSWLDVPDDFILAQFRLRGWKTHRMWNSFRKTARIFAQESTTTPSDYVLMSVFQEVSHCTQKVKRLFL